MNPQSAQRAVTTIASPMLVPTNEAFIVKFAVGVVVLAIGVVCVLGLMAVACAVMPQTAARCRAAVTRFPIQSLLAGLGIYAVFGSPAWLLLSHGYVPRLLRVEIVPGMLGAGLALVCALLALTVAGATGTVRALGGRLAARGDGQVSLLREVVVGTLAAVLGSLFPIIGWGIVMPGLMLASAGAPLVGWLRRRQLE